MSTRSFIAYAKRQLHGSFDVNLTRCELELLIKKKRIVKRLEKIYTHKVSSNNVCPITLTPTKDIKTKFVIHQSPTVRHVYDAYALARYYKHKHFEAKDPFTRKPLTSMHLRRLQNLTRINLLETRCVRWLRTITRSTLAFVKICLSGFASSEIDDIFHYLNEDRSAFISSMVFLRSMNKPAYQLLLNSIKKWNVPKLHSSMLSVTTLVANVLPDLHYKLTFCGMTCVPLSQVTEDQHASRRLECMQTICLL